MAITQEMLPSSLHLSADGVIRIGDSRVTLDTLMAAFSAGATPEQILIDFPTLVLADIYLAIGYILQNRSAVEEYVAAGETAAEAFRVANPGLFATNVRERLLARKQVVKIS